MYKIDNDKMLKLFIADGEEKHIHICERIINAGKLGLIRIEFYCPEENTPSLEYVSFETKRWGEEYDEKFTVTINTMDERLLDAACKKIRDMSGDEEVVVITTHSELVKNDIITRYFDVRRRPYDSRGIAWYALLFPDKVPELTLPDDVTISVEFVDNDGNSYFLFELCSGGEPAAILSAYLLYRNIYDMGGAVSLGYAEGFSGRGYDELLTLYFVRYCLDNGLYPYNGLVTSERSENVALKCGFDEVYRHYAFPLTPKARG